MFVPGGVFSSRSLSGSAMWCPHVPSPTYMPAHSHLSCNPSPPQRLVWMPSTLEQWGGERGRWVRRGGRGQTGCNLELSYCFNKRLKVQQRCSNSYQQPLTHSVFLLDAASPPQEALCFHSASQLYSVCAAY